MSLLNGAAWQRFCLLCVRIATIIGDILYHTKSADPETAKAGCHAVINGEAKAHIKEPKFTLHTEG